MGGESGIVHDNRSYALLGFEPRVGRKPIVFIDGGNNEIYSSASKSIQLIKTSCITFRSNIRERIENKRTEVTIRFEIKDERPFFLCDELKIGANDKHILDSGKVPPVSKIGGIIRRIYELKEALKKARELEEHSIIVLDGQLRTNFFDKDVMDELKKEAIRRSIFLIGLVKTNRIFDSKGRDLVYHLNKETIGMRFITPLDESETTAYLARLNHRSEHLFRIEILKEQSSSADIKKIAGMLSSNSRDPIFRGYPYGLLLADKFARSTDEEVSYLRIRRKKGREEEKEMTLMSRSIDSHDFLDSV